MYCFRHRHICISWGQCHLQHPLSKAASILSACTHWWEVGMNVETSHSTSQHDSSTCLYLPPPFSSRDSPPNRSQSLTISWRRELGSLPKGHHGIISIRITSFLFALFWYILYGQLSAISLPYPQHIDILNFLEWALRRQSELIIPKIYTGSSATETNWNGYDLNYWNNVEIQ